jgi:hypothetical protein
MRPLACRPVSSGDPTSAGSTRSPHSDRATLRRLPRRSAPYLIALASYAALAAYATWPIARDPGGTVFGTPGDMTGSITLLRYRDELGVGPLSNAVTGQENAPFGLSLPGAISLPQIVVEAPAQMLTALSGNAVFAVNAIILLGLALTAFSCFALCLSLTANPWAAWVAGLGFGFNPWILERAHGHIHFTHLWSLPLILLALLWIRRGGGGRAWVAFTLALVAACYTNTYVSLFAAVTLGAFIVADLGAPLIRRQPERMRAAIGRAGFSLALLIAVMIPQAVVSVVQADRIDGLLAGTRSPLDPYTYGSRWWEWVTPSYRHPVFGEWTAPFLAARDHGSNFGETALYLGAVSLGLAFVGVVWSVIARRRGLPAWPGALGLCLVVAGLVVSLPRGISPLGFEIPMPSALLSQFVEPWRVYSRLFVVVSLGIAVLAAIGLARLLSSVPRRAVPFAAVAIGALVVFDLGMTQTSFPAEPPPVYKELAALPGAEPRVEYPLTPPVQAPHLAYIFYTQAAERPLVNGGRAGTTGGSFDARLQDPQSPWTAPALAGLGARWVVLHSHIYGGEPPELGGGYRRVGDFAGSVLYEVTADAPAVMATPGDGFGGPEPTPEARFTQWLEGREGRIAVVNTTEAARQATLRFEVMSFVGPRRVTILDGDDEVTSVAVGPEFAPVELSVEVPPGMSELTVRTDPGAQRIATALGGADPRSVSVRLTGIDVATPGEPNFRLG